MNLDYVEGGGTMHHIFNYTLDAHNTTFVRLHRRWINGTGTDPALYKGADMYLTTTPGSNAEFNVVPGDYDTFAPPTIDILLPLGSTNGTIRLKVVTNETSLRRLDTSSLFLPESQNATTGLGTTLRGLANGDNDVAKQVSFLTYSDKFAAGGWRFLTVGFL